MSENQNMDIDPNQAVADQSADQQQQPPVPIEPVVQILPVTQETEPREIVPLAAVLNPTPADDRQGELWSSQQSRRPSPSSSSGESYTGDTDDNISVHSKNSTTFIDFYQASIWEANDYIEELEKLLRSTKLRADRALSKLTAIVKMIKELQKPPTGVSMENLMLAKKKIRQLYEIEGEIKQRFKTPKPMQVDLEQQQQSTSDPATARQRNAEVLQQDLDRRAEEERRAAEKARAKEARLEEIAIQKAVTENLQVIEKIANKESELELAKRDLQNLKIRIENRFGIPYSEFQRRHLVIANLPPVGQGINFNFNSENSSFQKRINVDELIDDTMAPPTKRHQQEPMVVSPIHSSIFDKTTEGPSLAATPPALFTIPSATTALVPDNLIPSPHTNSSDKNIFKLIPRIWEIDPSESLESASMNLKAPKFYLNKWDGDLITYPGFLNGFKKYVHLRTDIAIPQKIHLLQGALPKEISDRINHLSPDDIGYVQRLKYLHDRYGDLSKLREKLWYKVTAFPNSDNTLPSIQDRMDGLAVLIDQYRQATEIVDEEQLFNIAVKKFPPRSYMNNLKSSQRNVNNLFSAIREFIKIHELVELKVNPTNKSQEQTPGTEKANNQNFNKRNKPKGNQLFSVPSVNKEDTRTFSRGKAKPNPRNRKSKKWTNRPTKNAKSFFVTGSSKPGPEIPDQSQNRQQDAPAPGTPRQRRALPKTIMKMDPYPNADCIFCLNGRHWSHLCCHPRYNTLQARVKAYQVRNLCFKCGTPHGYGTCPMPPPKCCRWFNCLSTEHHTNLCPNAPYPLNIAKAQGWVEALRDRKAASSPYERDDE